jgi:hypothetical protein
VDPDGRIAFLAAIPPALAYLTPIAAGISARIAMSSAYRFGMSMAIGETGFVAPASLALGAGKVASVVAKEAGSVTFYRAVNQAEKAQIQSTGKLEIGKNSLEGKWMAEIKDDAIRWGDKMNGKGKSTITEINMSKSEADILFRSEKLDGIGPARYGTMEQLQNATVNILDK